MPPLTFGDVGSGLIYAVIIAMWGAYFIPLWLRRYEERSEARSADRFSHAMRILSRRQAEGGAETASSTALGSTAAVAARSPASPRATARPVPANRRQRQAPRSLIFRRRRIFVGLLFLVVVTVAAAALTPITSPIVLGVVCVLVGYLVHLRLQARRSRELSRTRESVRRRTLSRLRRFDAAERIFQARRTLRDERAATEAGRRAVAESARVAAMHAAAEWQPVPVPLPTYVTKPVAPPASAPRPDVRFAAESGEEPFDQTAPTWMSAQLTEAAEPGPSATEAAQRRRAVND